MGGRNNKSAVSLDAMSKRLIERFSPRFRPISHFSDLSFTNLSPGNEREKWQPLSTIGKRAFTSTHIYNGVLFFCPMRSTFKCVFIWCIFDNYVLALAEAPTVRSHYLSLVFYTGEK